MEDDPVAARVLEGIMASSPYRSRFVTTAEQAQQAFETDFYPVVIVDLHLPQRSGDELIQELNERRRPPIILVHTVEKDAQNVIQTMKLGVYDYLIKPVNEAHLFDRLEKAFEVFELRQMQRDLEDEREIRVRKQLSWNLWKETLIFRNGDRFDQSLFQNLHTIVSQGKGFGMLVSMVRDLHMMAKETEEGLVLPHSLLELLSENARSADQAIQQFQRINRVLKQDPELEAMSVSDLYGAVGQLVEELQEMARLKGQSLFLSSGGKEESRFILLEGGLFFEGLREILINAMKFSTEGSSILILFKPLAETLEISVVSEPMDIEGVVGIPTEHETAVFEPFYRIGKTVDERFSTLDYGLGLTLVDKIFRKHGGRVKAFNVKDHLNMDRTGLLRVNLQSELPLLSESDLQNVNLQDPGKTLAPA